MKKVNNHALYYKRCGVLVASLGLLVSLYGVYIDYMLSQYGDSYKPMCDVNRIVSCSTAMHSQYGTGFGVVHTWFGAQHAFNQNNATYGVVLYTILIVLQLISSKCTINMVLVLTVLLNVLTVYFVSVLIELQTICIVCLTLYLINALLVYINFMRTSVNHPLSSRKSK